MSYINEQHDFLFDVSQLIKYATIEGFQVTGSQLERPEELQLLYFHGKRLIEIGSKLKLVDYKQRSKTRYNVHGKRRAIDLNFFLNGIYINALSKEKGVKILQPLADYWKTLHPRNRWGGEFKTIYDPDHFERK